MPQIASPKDYSRLLALICVLLPVGARPAIAQNITPARDGTGTVINNNGQRFDITGGTSSGNGTNLFHSFQQFNLDAGQTANFISAPNIQNILGRVTGGNASIINGLIQVTGGNSNLYLMNPAGVIFGPNASLNVPASFSVTTATGIGFGNNWFNAIGSNDYQNLVGTPIGYRFDVSQPGAIVNSGNLELSPGQDLTLTGGTVINTGELSTAGGNITIAAVEGGDVVRISQEGHLLNLEVSNFGGNQEEITPLSLPGLLTEGNFDSHATGLTVGENGEVVLTSRNQVSQRNLVSGGGERNLVSGEPGTAIASGNIDTSSSNIGGEVNIVGRRVGILDANINTDGINGGGDIFIGGDFQGNSRLPASQQTVINNNSFISANALENGNGGRVIIWSDGTTRFEGNISVTGGEFSGDGGFVEVSGKRQLLVNGFIDVSAANGEAGTILFDPENITVDELAADVEGTSADGLLGEEKDELAADVEGTSADGLLGGENTETTEETVNPFAPDADYNVTISADNIESLEGNVTLQADNDITVNQPINTSGSVELKAGRSLNINANIDTSSGNGNINLLGNDNGANIANRSSGAANINQRENNTLNAGSGNITLRLENLGEVGEINVENLTTTGRVLINANGGNIGRVSPNSLINADSALFLTSGSGGIGLLDAPLRLDVENLEAEAGSGGAFFDVLGRVNVGGVRDDLTGILTTGGGDVVLSAERKITVAEDISTSTSDGRAGDITLESRSGGIDSAASRINASSELGDGGDVSVTAAKDINAGSISANGALGGNILLESDGDIFIDNSVIESNTLSSAEGTGGDIEVRGRSLFVTRGGQIDASVEGKGNAGKVNIITEERAVFDGEGSDASPSGAFSEVKEGAVGNAGGVTIETGSLEVTNGARISASTFGRGDAGGVNIAATDTVVLDGESSNGGGSSRALSRVEEGAEGNAGGVTIETGSLKVTNGAFISASTFGTGDAGGVNIAATDTVVFDGEDSTVFPSAAFSAVGGGAVGNAGGVTIETGSLEVTNGAVINASTLGRGNAGSIIIRATDTVLFDGEDSEGYASGALSEVYGGAVGNAGGVTIETGSLEVTNGAKISANTYGMGNAGSIIIRATDTVVFGGEDSNDGSGAFSEVREEAVGNAGGVTIETGSLEVTNGAFISASTFGRGDAGSVNIAATDTVVFNGEDSIGFPGGAFSEVVGGAVGNAGGVTIETGSLKVTNGAVISASTYGMGNAGSIIIWATDTVVFDGENSGGYRLGGASSQVRAGGEGNAGGVTIETSSLEVINGAQIDASTYGIGNAGSIIIRATDTVVFDGKGSDGLASGASSQVYEGAVGNAGGVTIETGSLEVTNGAFISASTAGRGDAGNVNITTPLINIDRGEISAFTETSGSGGDIFIASPESLNISGNGEIKATTSSSGNAGSIEFLAQNLTLSNGADITASTTGEGNAGTINLQADRIDILESSQILAFTEGSGAGGNITIIAPEALNLDANTKLSVETSSPGRAGNIVIGANTINIGEGAEISARATATSTNTEDGGNISINTSQLNITGQLGIFAETAGEANAGTLTVNPYNNNRDLDITFSNDGFISASTSGTGNGGNIDIYAPESIDITGDGNIFVRTTGSGNAGSIEIETDNLTIADGTSISASTEGPGNAGVINITTETFTLERGTSLTTETDSAGQAGNIEINSRQLTIADNAQISATARSGATSRQPGGNITINASELLISGELGIFAETAGDADAGTLALNPWRNDPNLNITFTNDGFISARTTATGNGGNINIFAPKAVNISGDGKISVETTGSGNAGTINIDTQNLTLTDGVAISAETNSPGTAGNININSQTVTIGEGTSISATAREASTATEAGGNISINASELLISGELGIFAETAGESPAGTLNLNPVDGSGNLKITFANDGFISARTTSTGNGGNINIFATDSIEIDGSGRITVETRGRGNAGVIDIETRNLSIAEGVTISAATFDGGDGGSIDINSRGTFRLAGTILAETRGAGAGGDVVIDAGNLIAPNSTISARSTAAGNAGNIDITTVGNAIVGVVTSSANSADGGNIEIVSEGSFIEATQPIQSFSNGGNAGDVTLQAQTDITANTISSHGQQQGGEIKITATTGNIDTSSGSLTNYSGGGSAGNVSLAAPTGNVTAGNIYSFANEDGGQISINAGGDIEIIENSNIITASEPSTTASEASGGGGDIVLEAGGNINTSAARIYSGADDGDTGTVGITGENVLEVGQIDLASGFVRERLEINDNFTLIPRPQGPATSGVAGNISITSNSGTVDTTAGTINSRSPDGSGNITINALGDITTGNLTASALNPETPTRGGDIEITSSRGEINAGQPIETFSERGTAGNVNLTAKGSIRTETILSQGTQRGGDINIDSNSKNSINIEGALNTFSTEGIAGDVTLASPGTITLSGIRSEGRERGGIVRVTSEIGEINSIGDIDSFSEAGVGGNVELNAPGSVNLADVSSFGMTQSGDLLIQSSAAQVNTGNVTTQAPGGDSGSIVINGESVGTGDLSSIGTTSAGAINVEATDGSIATYDVEIRSDGTVGAITLRATEDVTTGDIDQVAGEGDANIEIESGGDQTIGDLNQVAEQGDATNVQTAGGDQTVGNINQTAGGNATNVQTAGGNQTVGNINQTAGGDATNVQTAGGNQTVGNINQTAGGDATNVQTAGGNQTVGNINQTAGGDTVNFPTVGGNQTLENINQTTGGNVTNFQTAEGNQTIGNLTPDGSNDAVNFQTAGGQQNLGAVNQTFGSESINIQNPGVGQNLPVTPNNNTSILNTGDFNTDFSTAPNNSTIQNAVADISNISNPTAGNPQGGSNSESGSIANSIRQNQEILEGISPLNSRPTVVAANSETLTMLEESRNREFADYLGLDLSEDVSAIKNVREVLGDIEKQTGKRSAVVYVSVYPDGLQLILYTAEGEPILHSVPDANREEVRKVVGDFNYKIQSPLFRNGLAYLKPAQQLYQWLIAPMAAELEAANIDTLLFSMDSGLRALPVAALHDGERFLIEKYSLSLIPSISLMDTRYRSLEDTRVLAMGASEFIALNPLPAVPVELETIAQRLWQGRGFLNEEFTLDNFNSQRGDYPYPIIHLATHGEFKPGEVSNSYIQFWGDEKLSLNRVRELGLNNPPVELLVLSACRTAVGDTNAELGFAGLAVAAGVKSALASLWYVSDEGTLGLMTEFYTHLNDVTIKAEALRQAQLAMLRGEVKVTEGELRGSSRGAVALPSQLANIENNNLSHPYYWAGFTMIGSPW